MDNRFRLTELDLLRRYAAYVYYRAHGWIVRPGLALGGVHFLLYAQGPMHRHAAFAVLVDPATDADSQASKQVTCGEMAAHVRVVHSVGKVSVINRLVGHLLFIHKLTIRSLSTDTGSKTVIPFSLLTAVWVSKIGWDSLDLF